MNWWESSRCHKFAGCDCLCISEIETMEIFGILSVSSILVKMIVEGTMRVAWMKKKFTNSTQIIFSKLSSDDLNDLSIFVGWIIKFSPLANHPKHTVRSSKSVPDFFDSSILLVIQIIYLNLLSSLGYHNKQSKTNRQTLISWTIFAQRIYDANSHMAHNLDQKLPQIYQTSANKQSSTKTSAIKSN